MATAATEPRSGGTRPPRYGCQKEESTLSDDRSGDFDPFVSWSPLAPSDTSVDLPTGSSGGAQGPSLAPEPPFDPDEPWCELPPLTKVPMSELWDLIEALRQAGVPVRSPGVRRSGLFSGGKVNVTLSVPERLRSRAIPVIVDRLPDQDGYRS